jgi:hypothetical protein
LKNRPFGANCSRRLHELDLAADAGFRNRDCKRQLAIDILGHPLHELAALGGRKLVDFTCQAQHPDAMHLMLEHRLNLPAHGIAGKIALLVEEGIDHRVDAEKP